MRKGVAQSNHIMSPGIQSKAPSESMACVVARCERRIYPRFILPRCVHKNPLFITSFLSESIEHTRSFARCSLALEAVLRMQKGSLDCLLLKPPARRFPFRGRGAREIQHSSFNSVHVLPWSPLKNFPLLWLVYLL